MPLNLTITPAQATPGQASERRSRTLAGGTLSIGRAAGNDWVLGDDPHLSRTHCLISYEGGHYWLTDLSTNGMFINGAREATSQNSRTALTDGDSIRLGGYVLDIAETDAATSAVGGDPLDVDPLADPLSDPLGAPASSGFSHPQVYQAPVMRMDDPFDSPALGGGVRSPGDEDLFRGASPANPWQGPAQPDNAAAVVQAYAAPRPVAPVDFGEIDFDALLGDSLPVAAPNPLSPQAAPASFSHQATPLPAPRPPAAPPPASAGMDAFDDLLGDDFAAPVSQPPAPVAAPPAPVAAQQPAVPPVVAPAPVVAAPVVPPPVSVAALPAGTPSPFAEPARAAAPPAAPASAALLAAFLDGAGMSQLDLAAGDQEAAMRAIGALFRAFVGGTRDVLMSRAEIKHEMRVEQTMIRARDNNALKFSVSTEEALAALLLPNRPGYKPPLAAVEEAFTDIRSHELAVISGMQTGLIALLKRFDPAGLEARLQRGMLDSILPGSRKARFWELFCTTYNDIARDAADDFHAVFGRDFARAYDAQVGAQQGAQSAAQSGKP